MTHEQRRLLSESPPASIFDVADRAGVSASTVSRSLRGLPNVAPATRERVVRAAEELAYVPSPAASGLASGRTTTVGVVVPFLTRWFFTRVVLRLTGMARGKDLDLSSPRVQKTVALMKQKGIALDTTAMILERMT